MPKKKKSNHAKKASKKERESAKEAANNGHGMMANMNIGLSHQLLTSESAQLLSKLAPGCSLSPKDASEVVWKLARLAGTDVEMNDNDPFGDGDQTPVAMNIRDVVQGAPYRQVLREVFSAGGDLESHLKLGGFSPFAMSCCLGNAKAVEKAIDETVEGSDERTHLLERRESGIRLSPLLLAIAISKVKSYTCQITGTREADMNHVKVVKVLLRYGARPDCKELTGKSAVHYAAGSRATVDSLKMADYILEATKSCAYVGKRVTLRNLNKLEYNGLEGTLCGFDAETGRRQVTFDCGKQLSLLPKNIFSLGEEGDRKEVCIYDSSRNLLNECDRVGTISLHEVFLSNHNGGRVDVAEFLVERNVSVDITPPCGNSVRKLVYIPTPFGASEMHGVLRKYIVKMEKVEDNRCWGCKEVAEKLSHCSRCKLANYCSSVCQKEHWAIHKADCQNRDEEYSIQLSQCSLPDGMRSVLMNTQGKHGVEGEYKKPDGVDVGEKFWIKIQAVLVTDPLLVYDRSRSCKFHIMPGAPGHLELHKRVKQEKAFNGAKLYFKAVFGDSGTCRVYPNITSTTKTW